MSELRESAFIEISLFEDSKKKLSSKIFDTKTKHNDSSDSMDSKTFAQGAEVAVIETTLGNIELEFLEDVAPGHTKNFKDLANKGFYDGTIFHRVIPGFMIQGGDPNSKSEDRSSHGMGGPGYTIKAEFNDTPHDRGVLSMARAQDPNSANSQFFICLDAAPHLDRQYSVFGQVTKGMEFVDKIKKGNDPNGSVENPDKIISLTEK